MLLPCSRLPSPVRELLAGLALITSVGCSASSAGGSPPRAAPPAPASARPSAPPPSRPGLHARAWGEVASLRFALDLKLPESRTWQVDDQTTHWLLLRHVPSESELRVRTWRAARIVHPEDCERQARLWRPEIPTPRPDTSLDQRTLTTPNGYTTHTMTGVQPVGQTGTLEGFVLAFGASIGRCFAFVYTTRARGAGAEASIGDRLAIVGGGVLPTLHMRSIDDRVH